MFPASVILLSILASHSCTVTILLSAGLLTAIPFERRHCEAHRVELCVSMGCGNLIYKNSAIYLSVKQIATSRPNTNPRFAPRNDVYILKRFLSTNNY
jgi:hypothetical protein